MGSSVKRLQNFAELAESALTENEFMRLLKSALLLTLSIAST